MEDIMEDHENKRSVRLKTGIELDDLVAGRGSVFEINFDDLAEETPELKYDSEELAEHIFKDDLVWNTYGDDACPPFEDIAKKMVSVYEDGEKTIMKQIIRNGSGDTLPKGSFVTIDYNAYMEFNDEPFDSTYIQRKPYSFILDAEESKTIPGLDLAVQTMKINEKSNFLVSPDLAYGKLGCLDRVQPDSTILFEVEVKNCIDAGAAEEFSKLSEEQQNNFSELSKYCDAMCSKGNLKYRKGLFKAAVRDYNIAMGKLERFNLKDYEEQIQQQRLLLRLRTNVVISHTKLEQPKLACATINRIYAMCTDTELKVPTKIYFNHARCLMMLGALDTADKYLKKAHKLEPQNEEITREFIKLDNLRKKTMEEEKSFCKAMMGTKVEQNFMDAVTDLCKNLKLEETAEHHLPGKLSSEEKNFTEKVALEHGLKVKDSNGVTILYKVKNL